MKHDEFRIMILGDVHGDFGGLNLLLATEQPGMVIIVGDLGYFPKVHQRVRMGEGDYQLGYPFDPRGRIKNRLDDGRLIPIYWLDGNHEDHRTLREEWQKAGGSLEPLAVGEGCYWMPRGSSMTLPTGELAVFLGGARSVNRPSGVEGVDWFPEEVLGPEVLDVLPERADVVFSHTAPRSFGQCKREAHGDDPNADWTPDLSEEILDQALARLRPNRWYFGHFHWGRHGRVDGCAWRALADLTGTGPGSCWIWL